MPTPLDCPSSSAFSEPRYCGATVSAVLPQTCCRQSRYQFSSGGRSPDQSSAQLPIQPIVSVPGSDFSKERPRTLGAVRRLGLNASRAPGLGVRNPVALHNSLLPTSPFLLVCLAHPQSSHQPSCCPSPLPSRSSATLLDSPNDPVAPHTVYKFAVCFPMRRSLLKGRKDLYFFLPDPQGQ